MYERDPFWLLFFIYILRPNEPFSRHLDDVGHYLNNIGVSYGHIPNTLMYVCDDGST